MKIIILLALLLTLQLDSATIKHNNINYSVVKEDINLTQFIGEDIVKLTLHKNFEKMEVPGIRTQLEYGHFPIPNAHGEFTKKYFITFLEYVVVKKNVMIFHKLKIHSSKERDKDGILINRIEDVVTMKQKP